VAGHFFRILQDTLFEDVLLHLARFTDPRKSARKHNLSLQCLPELVPDGLRAEVGVLVAEALSATASARDWRNRCLAHRDLGVALATAADPLPGVSRADVEVALAAFRKTLHRIERHYWGSETYYQMLLAKAGDADHLVYTLQRGIVAEEHRMARFRSGRTLPEDLQPVKEV
jgi:hypothetical protein